MSVKLRWSHIVEILPIKNENARNYYINQIILNNLSVRELRKEIKNKAFDRLSYADKENIKLIEDNNYKLTIKDMIKDPILIKVPVRVDHLSEKVLHKRIIMMLEEKFMELGLEFALIGHEYKINIDNKNYFLDLLFFNYELNAFVVIEVKIREFKPKDLGQLDFYVKYVDKNLRKSRQSKTIGILIVKKKNKFVIEYTTDKYIITTFKLTN